MSWCSSISQPNLTFPKPPKNTFHPKNSCFLGVGPKVSTHILYSHPSTTAPQLPSFCSLSSFLNEHTPMILWIFPRRKLSPCDSLFNQNNNIFHTLRFSLCAFFEELQNYHLSFLFWWRTGEGGEEIRKWTEDQRGRGRNGRASVWDFSGNGKRSQNVNALKRVWISYDTIS